MTRPAPIIAGTLASLLLLFGAYMGSYYAMLEGKTPWLTPTFRVESTRVELFYAPAFWMDCHVRPSAWDIAPETERLMREYGEIY
jgi:hypothetical protein